MANFIVKDNEISDHLIKAEITQACHRNRPLRYHDRTLIVLSSVAPDYLPVTTEIVDLPRFVANKKDAEERLKEALDDMIASGERITAEGVSKRAHVRKATNGDSAACLSPQDRPTVAKVGPANL